VYVDILLRVFKLGTSLYLKKDVSRLCYVKTCMEGRAAVLEAKKSNFGRSWFHLTTIPLICFSDPLHMYLKMIYTVRNYLPGKIYMFL
jgi:hypothetical protein